MRRVIDRMGWLWVGAALLFPAAAGRCAEVVRIGIGGEPGLYSVEQWKADWPGCGWQDGVREGNVSVVRLPGAGEALGLRVNYRVGEIGPERGGCGWRYPIGRREAAELRYWVRFSRDFDWVKGGKLPGLSGGPENVSGGRPADGKNGFSARLMWRADGRGEAYVYHTRQPDRYGDRMGFPEDFRFPVDVPVRVRLRVEMNDPGKNNGKVQVWIGSEQGGELVEREVLHRTDLVWRSVGDFGVDSLYFETFHGGSDRSWAPTRPCWADFWDLSLR
ncbi:MAG: hypothetical protein JNK37_09500 [Verrucomicrobiales bacterium]|nr:hypothetical protein [Verrucomicrobiales bacterium]